VKQKRLERCGAGCHWAQAQCRAGRRHRTLGLRPVAPVVWGAAPAALLLVLLTGCAYEEQTVYWRPALSSVPGAVSGGEAFSERPKGYRDPTLLDDGRIRVESEEGPPVLVARTARHLMAHIYSTIKEDERELFVSQVLCAQTKKEFRERGMDPGEAFDYLKSHEEDIALLFGRMPMGEFSPGVLRRQLPGGVTRVTLNRKAANGLKWRGFEMAWEGGRMETVGPVEPEQVTVMTLEEAVTQTGSINSGLELVRQAEAKQPKQRFIQSGWKLRWFVKTNE